MWLEQRDCEDSGTAQVGEEEPGYNCARVGSLDFALSAIEVLEDLKHRSEIGFMFIKDPFDCHVKTRLTGEMGESDGNSTQNNRDLDKDERQVVTIFY